MRKVKLTVVSLLAVLLGWPLAFGISPARADDAAYRFEFEYAQLPEGSGARCSIEDGYIPGKGRHFGWMRGRHRSWDKQKMLRMKKEEPERFMRIVCERRENLKQRLQDLKARDPQRYERMMQRVHHRRCQRLQRLKEEDPKKFKKMLKERKHCLKQHLKQLKSEEKHIHKEINRLEKQLKNSKKHYKCR